MSVCVHIPLKKMEVDAEVFDKVLISIHDSRPFWDVSLTHIYTAAWLIQDERWNYPLARWHSNTTTQTN